MRIVTATVAAVLLLAACSSGPAALELTAEQIVIQLAQRVPAATPGVVFTAETDPNNLLGRPSGYTSKASFTDSRIPEDETLGLDEGAVERGGSVEVFDSQESAEKRKRYIDGIAADLPFAAEYSYVNGPVLLRVSRVLTPEQAAEYERALAEIG